MKYLFIILIVLSVFLVSCDSLYTLEAVETPETVTVTSIVTETVIIEDTQRIEELQKQLADSKEESEKYRDLISNLNELLKNVYSIKVSNSNYSSEGTGFSVKHRDKYYMISAGHGVHYVYGNDDVLYTNFKFLLNGNWFSLELLDYNNDYNNKNDYAIFISDKIDNGFNVDLDNDKPLFLINDTFKLYWKKIIDGESGSPVIDLDGEVTEIATTDTCQYNTDIDIVLQAIDNLE